MVLPVLALEEHDGSPVVGKVLHKGARSASRLAHHVVGLRVHGDVERVSADNLVQVRRVEHSRVDEGVDAVDDELGAGETEHVLARDALCQESGGEERNLLHICGNLSIVSYFDRDGMPGLGERFRTKI